MRDKSFVKAAVIAHVEDIIHERIMSVKKASALSGLLANVSLPSTCTNVEIPNVGCVRIVVASTYNPQPNKCYNRRLIADWLNDARSACPSTVGELALNDAAVIRVVGDAVKDNSELYNDILRYAYVYVESIKTYNRKKIGAVISSRRAENLIQALARVGIGDDAKLVKDLRLMVTHCSVSKSNVQNVINMLRRLDLLDAVKRHHSVVSNVVANVHKSVPVERGIDILAKVPDNAVAYWCDILARRVADAATPS